MDLADYDRLAQVDRSVICGLIQERIVTSDAGDAQREQDFANWRGVRDALDAAAQGAEPARRLDRPPRWLQRAATTAVGGAARWWGGRDDFLTVRFLERLGLVELEHDETYVLAVIGGLVGDPRFAAVTRADVLRADPDLREEVIWRLFEVEGGGEVSLANLDKFCRTDDRRWSTTFHELVDDGTLERADVLTACLGALARDFSAYRAGWFSRLYRSFEPTPAESAQRQAALRLLLRSEVTATVTMALRHLRDVASAGLLDDEETARRLGPAMRQEPKATVDAALSLAEGILRRRPDLAGALADALTVALGHAHPGVQERAGRLLQSAGLDEALRQAAGELSPAVAQTLGVRAADERLPEVADHGVDPALPADVSGGPAVRPARGAELVEAMAALLEDASDPLQIESVLAGLAEKGPTDALAALDKRAAAILERGPRDAVTPGWLRGQLARLVRRSAGNALPALPWTWDGRGRPPAQQVSIRFLVRRIDEVGDVLDGHARPGPLAATPESRAGWVEPQTLVSRVGSGATTTADLVGGLLRLAPEGRAAALATIEGGGLDGCPAVVRRVLRHALTDGPTTDVAEAADDAARALWVAAARARGPLMSDELVGRLGLGGAGRAEPIGLRLGVPRPWEGGDASRASELVPWIEVEAPASAVRDGEPTAVGHLGGSGFGWSDPEEFIPWAATIYPADAEHLAWLAGYDVVFRALSYAEVRHDAVRVLDGLRVHEGRVGPLTEAVLAAGLSGTGVDERVRAIDAVVSLAGRGQLGTDALGAGIVAVGPVTPLARLAGSLRDLAAAGPGPADLVVGALAVALPHAPVGTRGLHSVLEVLLDEVVRSGRRAPAGLAPWLAQFRGTSRSAALAARLAAAL